MSALLATALQCLPDHGRHRFVHRTIVVTGSGRAADLIQDWSEMWQERLAYRKKYDDHLDLNVPG